MTALVPFDYSGRQVRTVQVGDVPWIHHADVCAVLEHTNPSIAIRLVEDDDKQKIDMRDVSAGGTALNSPVTGNAEAWFISESGFYDLVFASKAKGAKAFKRWLSHEVMPALRRNGRYEVASLSPRELAQMVIAEADRADVAEAQVKALQPKADYVDGFVGATTDATLLRVLANQLGVKEADLRDLLVQRKVIYRKLEGSRFSRSKGRQIPEYSWHAYSDYSSWFVERDQPEAPRLHNGQMRTTLYVTPVGKVKVADLIAKAGAA